MADERKFDPDRAASETFLGRWSRVKTESRETATSPSMTPAEVASAKASPDSDPPELPTIENLTLESDYSGFFHPKVGEGVRRAALRKLFSDPHFNVMDGLDVYIDDYSKAEPIPAAMLASLKQAQRIIGWAAEKKEDYDGARAAEQLAQDAATAAALTKPDALSASTLPPEALPALDAPSAAVHETEPDAVPPKT